MPQKTREYVSQYLPQLFDHLTWWRTRCLKYLLWKFISNTLIF